MSTTCQVPGAACSTISTHSAPFSARSIRAPYMARSSWTISQLISLSSATRMETPRSRSLSVMGPAGAVSLSAGWRARSSAWVRAVRKRGRGTTPRMPVSRMSSSMSPTSKTESTMGGPAGPRAPRMARAASRQARSSMGRSRMTKEQGVPASAWARRIPAARSPSGAQSVQTPRRVMLCMAAERRSRSPTRRMRSPSSRPSFSGAGARSRSRMTVKAEPSPSWLSTWMVPPRRSTSCLVMAIPSPEPWMVSMRLSFPRVKESKRTFWNSWEMPTPVSLTWKVRRTCSGWPGMSFSSR